MSVCLSYQSVYCDRYSSASSVRCRVGALILLLAVFAFKVMIKVQETDLGYALSQERERATELTLDKRELQLQLSVVTRPDLIREEAREQLGLEDLRPEQARRVTVISG